VRARDYAPNGNTERARHGAGRLCPTFWHLANGGPLGTTARRLVRQPVSLQHGGLLEMSPHVFRARPRRRAGASDQTNETHAHAMQTRVPANPNQPRATLAPTDGPHLPFPDPSRCLASGWLRRGRRMASSRGHRRRTSPPRKDGRHISRRGGTAGSSARTSRRHGRVGGSEGGGGR